jgi:hypothetical protein
MRRSKLFWAKNLLGVPSLESLRQEHQPIKALRAVSNDVCCAESRSGCGEGVAKVSPVARTQVGIALQLIRPSGLRAPSQTQLAVCSVSAGGRSVLIMFALCNVDSQGVASAFVNEREEFEEG